MESLTTGEAVVPSLQVAQSIIEVLPTFAAYDGGGWLAVLSSPSAPPFRVPYATPTSSSLLLAPLLDCRVCL
jgi:hypothetical protein